MGRKIQVNIRDRWSRPSLVEESMIDTLLKRYQKGNFDKSEKDLLYYFQTHSLVPRLSKISAPHLKPGLDLKTATWRTYSNAVYSELRDFNNWIRFAEVDSDALYDLAEQIKNHSFAKVTKDRVKISLGQTKAPLIVHDRSISFDGRMPVQRFSNPYHSFEEFFETPESTRTWCDYMVRYGCRNRNGRKNAARLKNSTFALTYVGSNKNNVRIHLHNPSKPGGMSLAINVDKLSRRLFKEERKKTKDLPKYFDPPTYIPKFTLPKRIFRVESFPDVIISKCLSQLSQEIDVKLANVSHVAPYAALAFYLNEKSTKQTPKFSRPVNFESGIWKSNSISE